MVADVIVVMEVQDVVVLSGSSLSFAAVVATMVLADLAAVMVVVATIAVALSGFYLSFASVVATMALAVAEIPAANLICKSHRRRCVSTPFSYFFHFYNKCGGTYSHRRLNYYSSPYSGNSYNPHQFHKWCFLQ